MVNLRKQRILEKLAQGSVLIGGNRVLRSEIAKIVKENPKITMLELSRKLGGKGGSSFWKSGPGVTPVPK